MTVVVQDLIELAERCEKATGPDRRIDALIWKLQPSNLPDCLPDVKAKLIARILAGGDDSECPHYTKSLDAAMTLVLEEWWLTLDRFLMSDNPALDAKTWRVWLKRFIGDLDGDAPCYQRKIIATGPTPALALCAAALRARASIKGEG